MLHSRPTAVLLALGLLVGTAAAAQDLPGSARSELIRIDGSRSEVGFRVKVMWLLGVNGRFGNIDGHVRVDPFRNQLRVDARIDASSVRMSSNSYEEWVKSSEFFDAAHHPQIEFESAAFPRGRLKGGGELPGELTVRGVRQPVRFDLLPAACDRPAYDCPIRVNGVIRRSMFGMHSHHGTLGDKVELTFSVYALPAESPTQGSTPG